MKPALIPAAPLASFGPHDGELDIVEVQDDHGQAKRMCELGLCPGKRVRVMRAGNPAIVQVGESRFALAHELLMRVLARPAG